MGRQLTKEEIARIEEWNSTNDNYVSIEQVQDVMNWIPDDISEEDMKAIFNIVLLEEE